MYWNLYAYNLKEQTNKNRTDLKVLPVIKEGIASDFCCCYGDPYIYTLQL